MKLRNKNILLISPEPWDHIFVSKHHYATHLAARGNNVFFLEPPKRMDDVNQTEYEGVCSVTYKGFPKGLRYYPNFLQRYFINRVFSRLQILCDTVFDVIWSFDNSVFYDFSFLPKAVVKISHIVDLNQNFQTEKAAKTADLCFGSSNLILQRLKKYQSNSFFINHGFNQNFQEKTSNVPDTKDKIKVVYAGNLSMPYLDWSLIYNILIDHPTVDFIFIGSDAENFNITQNTTHFCKKDCHQLTNAHFIGKLKTEELHQWYNKADLLLISYQQTHHQDQSNPHKMMEYLGSGKMIIATKTLEYVKLANQGLIAMSDDNNNLPSLFKSVISNLDSWNENKKGLERIKYAFDNTYDRQLERIENRIQHL